ncbi:anti-FecI sigma factor, FecR [gut metagenome]|uniref:Anti-FecI sigma factor, FecR n=1 Tax=gut metagenome TaxID=749906 RepID=J9G7H5_9ZZZZ
MLTVSTGDEIKQLTLSDGTKVWLNKHTCFRYPQLFAKESREVYLEGEGYFEVAKNPAQPFVVHSDAMRVKVLGTIFNLKTDKQNKSAVATLLQGEIEVKGNHDEGGIVLTPKQQAELDGIHHRLVVHQITTGIENWHNSSFVFQNADIFTISRTLEKCYGINMVLSSDLNTKSTYSGVLIKSDRIENVLKAINHVIPVKYRIEGHTVYLSSQYAN